LIFFESILFEGSNWLPSKGDAVAKGVAAIWAEKESEVYGKM
jgi:hypothetical protein